MNKPDLKIPSWFIKDDYAADGRPHLRTFRYETADAGSMVLYYHIDETDTVPWDNPQELIDRIHQSRAMFLGLIEVETGKTVSGLRYIYSVLKSLKDRDTIRYLLDMKIDFSICTLGVKGYFDEMGEKGIRESGIYSLLTTQGTDHTADIEIERWEEDPYDSGCKNEYGMLMNSSEKKEYDSRFPQHPLSELRRFVAELISLN